MKNLMYLAFLVGLLVTRKAGFKEEEAYCEAPGDNIPVTLIEMIRSRR